ncbi:monosaccharide ABC transporter membrane protein (CUT2 family) [Actinocorallia herbida]|uniref:Monosaccharide ABC transporter membrane protein (CUT2 family) n=1 Tax=Actinocorallia herbida TaxID=58109 RepID=A0A3N1D0L6_9ACTN|nr:ABC transporter permease [Actinocorallia herbida]ROO87067.1 monosaccharide ABC transporter membrane protein (CUT2 family) [Actinocorallia herbida]
MSSQASPPAPAAPTGEDTARPGRGPRVRTSSFAWQIERFGLLGLFVVVMVVFGLVSEPFASPNNLRIILGTQAVLGLVALASIIPLISGQFDLSVGAIMGTCSIVTAAVMSHGHRHLAVAVAAALAVGALVGLVNGVVVAHLGVSSFIVTLAMATVLQGLVLWYTGGDTISGNISPGLISSGSGNWLGIPKGVLWLLPVALVLWYVLGHTPWGRHLGATGSNERAARLAGLRVRWITVAAFVTAGVVSGLAGVLQTGQAGSGDPQNSLGGILLPALAAAFLGSSAFSPGRFNVPGTVLAVYFVAFAVSGFQFIGAASWIQQLFNGLALAGAVTLSTLLGRRRSHGA